MIALAPHNTERYLQLKTYTPAWKIGTGLPDSLPPGQYRVTGENCVDGVAYILLENAFRVPTDQNSCISDLSESQCTTLQSLEFRVRKGDVISVNFRSQ